MQYLLPGILVQTIVFISVYTGMPPRLQIIVGNNPVTHLANSSPGLLHGKQISEKAAINFLAMLL